MDLALVRATIMIDAITVILNLSTINVEYNTPINFHKYTHAIFCFKKSNIIIVLQFTDEIMSLHVVVQVYYMYIILYDSLNKLPYILKT